MVKNEKARPTVVAAGQANGKTVGNFHEGFTQSARERQTPIFDILPIGRERAISSEALAAVTGCKSVRELQKRIERERLAGAVILSDTHSGGYYRSNDPAELRRFVRTLNARARNTLRAAESAQMALNTIEGRESIGGWFNGTEKNVFIASR